MKYTDTKLNLLRKASAVIDYLGNSFEWVLRDCYDGCFLRNTEAQGGMFLGLGLMISHHRAQSYQTPSEPW